MRKLASRIVAPLIAGLVGWLGGVGLTVGEDFESGLTLALVALLVAVMQAVYGVAHKAIDRVLNPDDDA